MRGSDPVEISVHSAMWAPTCTHVRAIHPLEYSSWRPIIARGIVFSGGKRTNSHWAFEWIHKQDGAWIRRKEDTYTDQRENDIGTTFRQRLSIHSDHHYHKSKRC